MAHTLDPLRNTHYAIAKTTMCDTWQEEGDGYRFEGMSAERAADDGALIITSFGAEPQPDRVFAAIRAAMAFGAIRLRVTDQTRATIEALTGDGRIKCVRAVGTEHSEVGVMAVRRA